MVLIRFLSIQEAAVFSDTYGAGSDWRKLHSVEDYGYWEVKNVYTTLDANFEEKKHNNLGI